MSLSQFYKDWFGIHGGREVLLTYANEAHDRVLINSAEELENYVSICRSSCAPAYVSVQPYQSRDQPLGIEKLFFEFDCADDPSRAWEDARLLANSIIRYYDAPRSSSFRAEKATMLTYTSNELLPSTRTFTSST